MFDYQQRPGQEGYKGGGWSRDQKGPGSGLSTSQILALVTLLPVSGTLLLLAGITLTGTLIGLAVATPLFVIFSPVLVPAAFVIGSALMGFLSSGAFGITALSSVSWMANYIRQQMEQAKRRVEDTTGKLGQTVQSKGLEGGKT